MAPGSTATDSWQKALDRLDPDLKTALAPVRTQRLDVVSAVLQAADDRRQRCIRRQWRFTAPDGRVIVVRDVLEKVVSWINRYKAVGDVASQYDPAHAALPWAAFRFLLNATTGDIQAFGLMTTVLEAVARITARSKIIEDMYIRGPTTTNLAPPLEDALVLLFADALVLLAKCVKYFDRSTLGRAARAAGGLPIDDDDLKSLDNREAEVLKLAALANTKVLHGVDTKIEALTHTTMNGLAGFDAKFIRLMDTAAITQQSLEDEMLNGLLGWLSLVPVARHHKEVSSRRLPGSAAWLIHHVDFNDWLISSSSSVLLLHGVRGCGKSTAFSAVVDNLLPQPHANMTLATAPCAYFYCQHSPSEPDRASPSCILRSIVRQLAISPVDGAVNQVVSSAYARELRSIQRTRDDPSKPTVDESITLILGLTSSNPAYICIDAVDELPDADRASLVESLQRVVSQSASVVKVLFTSRDNAQLQALLESETKIRVTAASNEADIKAFVELQVDRAVQTRCLLNGTPSTQLAKRISSALLKGSGEMFLWVKLQIDFLCRKKTEQDILEALDKGLTGNLDQIYDHALRSILGLDPVAKRVAQQVISWLLFARRSLCPEALLSVLRLDPGLQLSNPQRVDLVDVCHNLVMLNSDNVLSFCHSSVRDFMGLQDMFSAASAHQLLATACLRQCTAGPGISPFVQEPSPIQDLYHYAAVYWPEHARHSETIPSTQPDRVTEETIHFLFTENTTETSPAFIVWHEWIRETTASLPLYHPLKHPFELILNPSFSPVHTACVFGLPTILSHLLTAHPSSPLPSLSEPNSDPAGYNPLYLAAAHGHAKVVSLLLSRSPELILTASFSTPCGAFGTPLNVAAFRGHVEVVRTLLRHLDLSSASSAAGEVVRTSAANEVVRTGGLASAYTHACRGGREGVARLLAEENSRLGLGLWETEERYEGVVKEAVAAGFRDLVWWLVGVRGRAASENGTRERELLLAAIGKGQVAVLRALLRMGEKWREALPTEAMALAAVAGHAEMVSFLHDEVGGVDAEAEGPFGSALRGASLMGYDRVVQQLLSWGADPKACGGLGDALQAAAQNGHTRVMKLLMDKGADCNQPGPPRGTCLQAAAYYGHRDAVALLLDQGADMYQGGESKDALHAAIQADHGEIALLFLERGYRVQHYPRTAFSMRPERRDRGKRRPAEKKREHRARPRNLETVPAHDLTDSTEDDGSDALSLPECESDSNWSPWDDDKVSRDSPFATGSELELNAVTGNIPNVRQQLLRQKHLREGVARLFLRDGVATAFRAATATGQVEVLRVLLPGHLDQTDFLYKALIVAARSSQPQSVRFLCERLAAKGAEDPKPWCSALSAAASSRDPTTTVRALLDCNFCKPSPTLLNSLASTIRMAAAAKRSTVVHVLWNWVFNGTMQNHGKPPSTPEGATAEPSLRGCCLGGDGKLDDADPGGQMSASLGKMLTAGLQSENADAVESLLAIMERQGLDVGLIMPAFASACRDGSGAVELLLRRKSGRLALSPLSFLVGAYTAAIFGHGEVLCILLDELIEQGISLSSTGVIDTAFIGAARHGHADILRSLLDTPRLRSSIATMQATVNHAVMDATKAGHIEVVRVCLQAGADIHSLVSPGQDMVHLDRAGGLAVELSPEDRKALRRDLRKDVRKLQRYDKSGPPPGHYERSLTGLKAGSVKTIHDLRRSHRRAGNGLHMALRGFHRPQDVANASWDLPATDRDPQSEAKIRQEALVSLMLENGCEPRKPDGFGQPPIEIAAKFANEGVVQKLLDAGIFAPTSSGEDNDRQLHVCVQLASQNKSATAFRVVLEFLRAGAKLPTTDDGQVTTEILDTLKRSFALVRREGTKRLTHYHPFSAEDARGLMDGGMRALLEITFSQLPEQKAGGEAFGGLLVVAATAGDQASVDLLLRHGAWVDSTFINYARGTALGGAAQFGYLDVMTTLLNAGARIEEGDIIASAVLGGHVDAVKALVERGATVQRLDRLGSPWGLSFQRFAVDFEKLEILQHLVTVNGQVDLQVLTWACAAGKADFAACLLSAVKRTTPNPLKSEGGPLREACRNGHADIARQLIEHGANVNQSGHFDAPLIVAASCGHADTVRLLLDNGADPNQHARGRDSISEWLGSVKEMTPLPPFGGPNGHRRQQDEQTPFTALSMACRGGFPAVVELLLSRGAAIAGSSDPATGTGPLPNALASTCEGNWSPAKHAILELLLETASTQSFWHSAWYGALFQAARAHNHAAFDLIMEYVPTTSSTLLLASMCGGLPSIAQHLNQGINPQTQDSNGELPLHTAAYHMHPIAVSHLLTHGAADANQLSRNGFTPLLCALWGFHALLHNKHLSHEYQADMGIVQFEAVVRCLLDHGARTDLGETPLGQALDLAGVIGYEEVERLLQEREARDSGLGRFEQSVLVYCRRIGEDGRGPLKGYSKVVVRN